jgi:hypothetical protein
VLVICVPGLLCRGGPSRRRGLSVSHLPSAGWARPVWAAIGARARFRRAVGARRPPIGSAPTRALLTLDAAAPRLHYLTGPRGGSKTTDAADTGTKPRCWWEPSAGWWAGPGGLGDLIKVRDTVRRLLAEEAG